MKKRISITENQLKGAVNSVLNEFLSRDEMDNLSSFGIQDPTENDIVNEEELKQKCTEFAQKCNEFLQYLNQFDGYINGVEEDNENGIQRTQGVKSIARARNMFGARDLHDEYLEENLENLSKSIQPIEFAIKDAVECAEMVL